jgi:M6 family metalloprotease-like protein
MSVFFGVMPTTLALEAVPPPIDPQSWKLNRDQTWDDFTPNPVINWNQDLNPASLDNKFAFGGNSPNLPIVGGLVLIEYLDRKFISRGDIGSDPLGYYLYNNDGSGMQSTKSNNPIYNVPKLIADEKYGGDVSKVTDAEFAQWWANYLNKPQEINNFAAIDTFWRECSYGKWAIDLRPYGPFTIPYFEFETMGYDHGSSFQTYRDVPPSFRLGTTGTGNGASFDTQAQNIAVANNVPFGTFDFFFLFHAGYDESGVWQEFGQSQFATRKDIPYELGPGPRMAQVEKFFTANPSYLATYATRYANTPSASFWTAERNRYNTLVSAGTPELYEFKLQKADWDWVAGYNDQTQRNTRYVNFTSWEAAVGEWSHAGSFTYGGRSIRRSTQGENDGMATFAHEFGHISGIGDNYGTPWTDNYSPATEPWELMSRGSFAGPFGDHARWSVPGVEAGSVPVHFMQRNKETNQFFDSADILTRTMQQLVASTPLVVEIAARNVPISNNAHYPWLEQYGLKSPNFYKALKLNFGTGTLADQVTRVTTGFTWNRNVASNMTVEVVQRTGYDSFAPDDGVLISRNGGTPYTQIIDSHLYDIAMIDYELNGEYTPYPMAHAAQLFDAAFHAGKSFVDTGYYRNKYDPTDPNYSQARPIYYDSSFNRIWTKRMLEVGSIVQWEPRNGRDIVSGNTVNEFFDTANKLHFYILDKHMNPAKNGEFLSYQIGVLRTDGVAVAGQLEVIPEVVEAEISGRVAVVNFNITNKGATATDIIRVGATGVPDTAILNDLYAIDPGKTVVVPVYVSFDKDLTGEDLAGLTVGLDVSSESNVNNKASASIGAQTAFANTVTFVNHDGAVLETQKVVFNTGAALPTSPERFGYTLTGWNLEDKSYDFDEPVTEDITLVAQWIRNPITYIRITNSQRELAPVLVMVARKSTVQFDYEINSNAIRDGIVWSVSNTAMAVVNEETGLVTLKNLTGTLVLTAEDSLNGASISIVLRVI